MADVEVTHRELVERRAAAERLEARGLQVHRIVGGLVLASENVVQVKSHLQVRNAAGLDKALSFVTNVFTAVVVLLVVLLVGAGSVHAHGVLLEQNIRSDLEVVEITAVLDNGEPMAGALGAFHE
jgi:hypothetical protein